LSSSAASSAGAKRPAVNDANDQLKRRRLEAPTPVVMAPPTAGMYYQPGPAPMAPTHMGAIPGMPHPALAAQSAPPQMSGNPMYNAYMMSSGLSY